MLGAMTSTVDPSASAALALSPQPISEEVLLEKYAKGDERSADDVRRRVARALAAVEPAEQRATWEARFLAPSRTASSPPGASIRPRAPS